MRSWPGWMRALPALPLLLPCVPAAPAGAGALERAMLGKSAVVDLTHPQGGPPAAAGPGDGPPPEAAANLPDGGRVPSGAAPRDLGTRLHAGRTVRQGKKTVAAIPLRDLLVQAVVVDIAPKVAQTPGYRATVADFKSWERRNGRIPRQSAVLLRTGWDRRWADPGGYVNLDAQGVPQVPGFSPAALAFLAGERGIRGIGLDVFNPQGPAGDGEAASSLAPANVWRLENLTSLERLPTKGVKLVIAPLRVEANSAPVRVIAILP